MLEDNYVNQKANRIRVLVADDHRTLREGLKLLLESDGDIEVVAEAEDGKDAIAQAVKVKPDVVFMDIGLTGLDGIEATRRLHNEAPEMPILMLSAHPELHLVRATLEAGAIGYVLKRASGRELRDAVRTGVTGKPFFSDEIMHVIRERARASAAGDPARAENPALALTGREYEILQLIASGHSNREIAEMLSLSIKTVETHRMHLMEKLDIHDVAGLTRYAIRKGLIEC
jgi:DNA-binding NarL/FixJ family response regulator